MKSPDQKRILHITGGMDRGGGIQTYLMNIFRRIDREKYKMDFVTVYMQGEGAFDAEIRSHGSQVIPCRPPRLPWQFAQDIRSILRKHGPYDVIHSHLPYVTGVALRIAAQEGVEQRIGHCHNDHARDEEGASFLRQKYLRLMKGWIDRYATNGLGCSARAVRSMFGPDWKKDPRCRVLNYGLDFAPFHIQHDPAARQELGLAPDAFVIGHIGRFVEQKNHPFLFDIAREVARHAPETRLLLLGDGPLRAEMEKLALEKGIADNVLFAGVRPDIPRLLTSVVDVFALPSLFEGLGLVLIEAQAAGRPCVFSEVVPEEADVIPSLIRRLPLDQSAVEWAQAILKFRKTDAPVTQEAALAQIEASAFNLCASVKALENIYGSRK